jgi:uncharacterized membrane protein YbaN (DUF454 family)
LTGIGLRDTMAAATMKRHAVRVARLGVGSVLILVGVVGGFIPVFQGWVFVLAGLSLLAQESERARYVLDRLKARLQGLASK